MIPENNPEGQSSIFDTECTNCQLYQSCGGSATAPCGCIQTDIHKRYDCANCHYICRERYSNEKGVKDSFTIHHYTARNLDKVQFKQDTFDSQLPLLVPLKTHKLPENYQFDVKWAAIDIEKILTNLKYPLSSSGIIQWPVSLRKTIKVPNNTKLLAILNGEDSALENFWGSNRHNVYEAMVMSDVKGVTGATFSVYDLTEDNKNLPESHKVMMLNRHHRIVQELASNELIPIPNIYCRNTHDVKIWIEWLSKNESIKLLSRDLTRTRIRDIKYKKYIGQLVEIIKGTGRSFHILFIGPSQGKAASLMKQFSKLGCTCG